MGGKVTVVLHGTHGMRGTSGARGKPGNVGKGGFGGGSGSASHALGTITTPSGGTVYLKTIVPGGGGGYNGRAQGELDADRLAALGLHRQVGMRVVILRIDNDLFSELRRSFVIFVLAPIHPSEVVIGDRAPRIDPDLSLKGIRRSL